MLFTKLKTVINDLLSFFDLQIVQASHYKKIQANSTKVFRYRLTEIIPQEQLPVFFRYIDSAKSQIGQDLFVLLNLQFKKNGFFVEFGATDGIQLSNTWLLEKEFSWKGILAEPARRYHKAVRQNRAAHIEESCIWHTTGEYLWFDERGELSGIAGSSCTEKSFPKKVAGLRYQVPSISVNDLLGKYNAPRSIDYLSVDTEGTEYEILASIDFNSYDIQIITVEHNFETQREAIHELLTRHGYKRRFVHLSLHDDWFVKE